MAPKRCATRLLDARSSGQDPSATLRVNSHPPPMGSRSPIGVGDRLRGKDPSAALRVNSGGVGVSVGSVHGYRIGERCGSREGGDGRGETGKRANGQR